MITAYIKLARAVYYENKTRSKLLFNEIFREGFALAPSTQKRIVFYTIQSAITTLWFSTMRGNKPTQNEIIAGLYLGACTPLYDDLTDEQVNSVSVKNLQSTTELLGFLIKKIREYITFPAIYERFCTEISSAQAKSAMQVAAKKLSVDELKKITYNKGGYATLLYRSILSHHFVKGEEDAIFRLGSLLQLINDMFDVYKDFHNKQQTLPLAFESLKMLHDEFQFLLDETVRQFLETDYKKTNIRKVLKLIFPVLARGKLCLNQLSKLHNTEQRFSPELYTRGQLICDMEKPSNLLNTYIICQKWSKLYGI